MSKKTSSQPLAPPVRKSLDLWEILGGAKFAVGLLLVWALLSSIGTFLPQGREPAEYQKMLGSFWSSVALGLGLDHMYYTPWFLALLGLFCLNLLVSSLNRIARLQREDRAIKVECPSTGLAKIATRVPLAQEMSSAATTVEKALRAVGLSYRKAEADGEIYYYAERGRWRRWGSTWAHIGLLIVFVGALAGRWPGVGYNGYVNILEGSSQSVTKGDGGAPSGMSLKVHRFEVVGDQTGRPRDYACDIELFDGDRSIERKTIRVNTPLEYGDVTFYQAGYGMAGFGIVRTDDQGKRVLHRIMTGPQGELDPESSVLWAENGSAYFVRQFFPHAEVHPHGDSGQVDAHPISNLPVNPAAEVFENPNPEKNPMDFRPVGWLAPGQKLKASDGSTLELGPLALFTGIQYRKDPGYSVVALGFVISTLGLLMSFYIGHRRVRVVLTPGPAGTLCYVAGIPGAAGSDPGNLPERLVERLGADAGPSTVRTRRPEHAPA